MPSIDRRAFLAAAGTTALGGLAGCSWRQSSETPAGTLTFENRDDLPHSITMRVTDVGTAPADEDPYSVTGEAAVRPEQRTLSASVTLDPGESVSYESVFTERVWYAVRFTVDGQPVASETSGRVAYTPFEDEDTPGRALEGVVGGGGEFSWSIHYTDNTGPFER
ncbi:MULTISPECIES: hypothetical protein [Halobacterium]|uniref:hypothetical protein n=1 Tax=Halobacterium TaxID=2239 RepID=UPI00073F8F85|nr:MULTISPECIES: hypothetical protein [Halobacterium]MCG1003115.1 hypothetical protein [Halobacterium noricense]